MKKLFVAMLTVLMLGSLCFGTFTALAQESEPEGGSKEYNLIDFENTDFGKHSYNAETGELTLAGTGTVSYLTTLLDSITDGKLVLKDGTAKDFSELTFVMRATISAKSLGGWQVPYIVFAKNDEATLQYHFRNTINNQYIFKNVGTAETVLQECGVGYVADESPYQMLIKKTGDTLFAQTIALPLANGGTITLEDKDMVPCFGVSAREVPGTVIKDMKMYVAPDQEQQDTYVELGAYAKSIGVKTAPAAVEQGEDLKDCTFTLNMLDGTTQELTLDDVTISGFDKNSAGKQTVTVSKEVLNSVVSTTFEVEVEGQIVTNLADFENADYGRNFYDEETGEVTLYGDDSYVNIPTVLDGITDGKLILKDGTEANISDLTFVASATIQPASVGNWTVPFLVFANTPNGSLDSHVRVNMGGAGTPAYIMCRWTDAGGTFHEDVLTQVNAAHQPEGIAYTVTTELTGTHVKYTLQIGEETLVSEIDVTHEQAENGIMPCFRFGDRTNADSVISNMQFYVKGVELGAYAKSIVVKTAPATVKQGEDLKDCTFTLNMLDGTTQELALDDVTISGFDKNSAGEQTVTVSADVLNSSVSTTFEIEVEAAEEPGTDPDEPGDTDEIESYRVSLNKTEYAFGEEFDISTVVVTAVYESGKTEAVTVADGDLSVSGYDKEKAGEQSVVITYKGTEYTLSVTVAESGGGETGGCSGTVLGAGSAIAAVAACLFAGIVLKKRANKNRV